MKRIKKGSIYQWCRDHRAHHKWADTDADPHNATRGFFFSHIGWLLVKKHPDVIRKGARLPLDDLLQDPVVYYQKMYEYTFLELIKTTKKQTTMK